jgi:hypothetical protein
LEEITLVSEVDDVVEWEEGVGEGEEQEAKMAPIRTNTKRFISVVTPSSYTICGRR